jgi:xanthine phosphoribosyltransferase
MRKSQKLLAEHIKAKGGVNGEIVKVDTFLNHLVDIELVKAIGEDIAEAFKDKGINKILTVEASGIVGAQAVGFYMDTNYIYAKKKIPCTMTDGFLCADSFSFTKNEHTTLYVSKEVISSEDKILFVDDFFAKGNTFKAIKNIADQAGAEIVACAVVIDKQGRDDVYSILTLDEIKEYCK